MMWFRRHTETASKRRDEAGFTLVDVVASVVLMGIVIGPLSISLVQSLQLVPAAGGRTQGATDREAVVRWYAQDISGANGVATYNTDTNSWLLGTVAVLNSPANVWDQGTGTVTCKPPGTTPDTNLFSTLSQDLSRIPDATVNPPVVAADSMLTTWYLRWTAAPGPVTTVELRRSIFDITTLTTVRDTTLMTKYCKGSETVATVTITPKNPYASTPVYQEFVRTDLNLRDNPAAPVPVAITLQAAVHAR
jgi:hypothetical protein